MTQRIIDILAINLTEIGLFFEAFSSQWDLMWKLHRNIETDIVQRCL